MKQDTDASPLLPSAFKAMGDDTRLKILLMLEGKARTVGEIVQFFDLSQPTITRHLQTLSQAGLVRRSKKAQHVVYELNTEEIRSFCVSLVSCFPCCCLSVEISPQEAGQRTEEQSGSGITLGKKTARKRPKGKVS